MITALSAVAEGPRASPARSGGRSRTPPAEGPRFSRPTRSGSPGSRSLLAARDRPHVRVSAERPLRQRRKIEAALEDLLAERLAPALVAALPGAREPPVLDHSLRREERTRADIHPSDMGMKQIDGVDRLAAQLRVEVQSAGSEASRLQNGIQPQRHLGHAVRELVGVPAQEQVAPVHVDAAEDAERQGHGDLVLEGVAGQGGVVDLDVGPDLLLEPEALEEGVEGGGVEIVLVLGRLAGFGLHQDHAFESATVLVVDDEGEEPAQLLQLALDVRIEEGLVALPAAPEDVVLPAELASGVHGLLDLRGRHGKDLRVRIGGGSRHVARVAEQVGGPPEQAHPGPPLVPSQHLDHRLEPVAGLSRRRSLGGDVAVVEGVERDAQPLEEVERRLGLQARRFHGVGRSHPRTTEGGGAEGIGTGPAEGVPPADGEPELLLHALAEDLAILVVVPERERVGALRSFVTDGLDLGEDARHDVLHWNARELAGDGCPRQGASRPCHPAGTRQARFFFIEMSARTARIRTTPLMRYCTFELTFIICKPLERDWMMRAPTMAPNTVPSPPRVEVPPRMQLAITSSS